MVYIIYKRHHVWQTPISIRTDVSDGYLYDYQSSKYVKFSIFGRILKNIRPYDIRQQTQALASQFTDEVTFSPAFQLGFFAIVSRFIRLLSSIIYKGHRLNHRTVGETTAVQRDGLTVALGVHVVVVHTRTTPVNDKTTPDRLLKTRQWTVEVDRCIGEISVSNRSKIPRFTEAPSIKDELL